MNRDDKISVITNHLVLKKQKSELELERFLNSDISVDELCDGIEDKLVEFKNSISNISMWLEFTGVQNNPEGE